MWHATVDVLENNTHRASVLFDDSPVSWFEVVRAWQRDRVFRDFFIGELNACPFKAFYWETPAIARNTADRNFEFVLIESHVLAGVHAEREAYAEYFDDAGESVAEFANLGGDAWLVAPTPQAPLSAYPHLAAFSRQAPQAQQHTFWQRVGQAIERRLGDQPMWVSTAGTGVYWLHVRLDSYPKYYNHRPYRESVRA